MYVPMFELILNDHLKSISLPFIHLIVYIFLEEKNKLNFVQKRRNKIKILIGVFSKNIKNYKQFQSNRII